MNDKTIQKLEKQIIEHKQNYYTGNAQISDDKFDTQEDELRLLNPDSYALSVVGFETSEQKVVHKTPMLSLEKTRDTQEVDEWMNGKTCMVSYKMDGSSASLIYQNGVFNLAKTRGDGTFGENITKYFKYIKMPPILFENLWQKKDVEIRGEVCISKSNFELLSDEMAKRKLDRPNSIRNIVAGLLHKKNDLDLCKYLDFIAYDVISDVVNIETEEEKFEILCNEGFIAPERKKISSIDQFKQFINKYLSNILEFSYLTDGLVLAINNVENQLARGFTAHHPKGKLAFKFKSEKATTKVKEIVVDVGRTGRLTFVGVVDPVVLSSATVRRVTLNNVKYIKDNNINIDCEIEITRSGEVIPKHEKTITTCGEYKFPVNCPVCEQPLSESETQIDLVCKNSNCKSRVLGRIANWIIVTGIENLGDSTLEKFFETDLVKQIEDLYKLKKSDIASFEGLGEKSAAKIVKNIQNSKEISIEKFLTGLGIDGLGKGIAKLVVAKYTSLESLREAKVEDLVLISGIGEVLAQNIYNGLNSFGNNLAENLTSMGVAILDKKSTYNNLFEEKSIVITGTLSRPRKEIQTFIEDRKGKVTSAISANTSFLVCNKVSQSSKYIKAKKLNIAIITEEELFLMDK